MSLAVKSSLQASSVFDGIIDHALESKWIDNQPKVVFLLYLILDNFLLRRGITATRRPLHGSSGHDLRKLWSGDDVAPLAHLVLGAPSRSLPCSGPTALADGLVIHFRRTRVYLHGLFRWVLVVLARS